MQRTPSLEEDGTATWSQMLLQQVLRTAPDGLSRVSTWTIYRCFTRRDTAGSGCGPGVRPGSWSGSVRGKRVEVTDLETNRKKAAIEQAYAVGEFVGLPVWRADEAGPYQVIPQSGESRQVSPRAAA